MLGGRVSSVPCAGVVGVLALVGPAHAQTADLRGSLSEVPLAGGLRAALAVIDDRVAPDRSQFLFEFIRRTYNTPLGVKTEQPAIALQALLGHIDAWTRHDRTRVSTDETVPLPLTPSVWINVVFDGRVTEDHLLSAILESRPASLLYYGLLSLDDGTRSWLATEPALLSEIAWRHSAALIAAAPGLRVVDGTVQLPGGALAEPAWRALVGHGVGAPAEFVRRLLSGRDGHLAQFLGAMGQLSPHQLQLALSLESPRDADRIAAAQRLFKVFARTSYRTPEAFAFWRPVLDPALLLSELSPEETGRPRLPGTERFWEMVFAGDDEGRPPGDEVGRVVEGGAVDFGWLCEQVFVSDQPRRYAMVLFASRALRAITPDNAADAVEAVRAVRRYPALVAALERAGIVDVGTVASAARRATGLSAIHDGARAHRALAQFQGILVLVMRAAARGSLPSTALPQLVSSLAAVDLGGRGDYEGRLIRWMDTHLPASTSAAAGALDSGPSGGSLFERAEGPMADGLIRMVAGRSTGTPSFVEWEGTRYRVDLATAEATRLARTLGVDRHAYVASARALLGAADALQEEGLTLERLRQQMDTLADVASEVGWNDGTGWEGSGVPGRYRRVITALERLRRAADLRRSSRLSSELRVLAEDLLARALLELAYAMALREPDRSPISIAEAASRHDFGMGGLAAPRRGGAWGMPEPGAEAGQTWHVTGSLLGLDVALAEFSLVRLSMRPPSRKPTVGSEDRRVFARTVALMEPAALTNLDRETIVSAMRNGRTVLAAVRTPGEAGAISDAIGLSSSRRTLLAWTVAHDPERLPASLSPVELLWLGFGAKPLDEKLHAWGTAGEPRQACHCLRLDRRPWEAVAGRWHAGMVASGFPDLSLRLAELLDGLRMPAPLLAPVLASATLEFVDNVISRDPDDRRGLVEFVRALGPAQVERYLALLTTGGPLVPVTEAQAPR